MSNMESSLARVSVPNEDTAETHQMKRRVEIAWTASRQIRALPPAVQNREAVVLVRCPQRALLVRVFRLADGELLVLHARYNTVPWLLDTMPDFTEDAVPARCKCCADAYRVPTTSIRAAVATGRGTVTVR